MSDKKDQQAAKIIKKPIHHQATRKVPMLPKELLRRSERPDGGKVQTVEDESSPQELAADPSVPDGGLFDDLFADSDAEDA